MAETLDVPVYLYDRAALVAERASLAEVRKGEFEGLRDAVARGERLPDFGPHAIGRAGATAVGARKPLVAFNVYLDGTDEAAGKEIARGVRESSGGLPALRAIAFAVPERGGVVTVSMNLVDHEVTGLRAAFDAVAEQAAGHGLRIAESEIVGLVPASALAPATWSTFACAGSTRTGRSWSGCWPPRTTRSERDGRTVGGHERGGVPRGPGLGRPDARRGRGGGDRRCDGRGADRDGGPAHGGEEGVRGPGGPDARAGGQRRRGAGARSWSWPIATRTRSTA